MSFIERMRAAQAETAKPVDPWRLRLERVRGTTGFDGIERISSQKLLDILEIEQRKRTAGTYRHLASLMAELGWTAVRVRDFNGRGFKEQVRGYVRNAPPFDERRITVAVTCKTQGSYARLPIRNRKV